MRDIILKDTRIYQEIKEDAPREGRQEDATNLISRQIGKYCELPEDIHASISELPLIALEELSEALLVFQVFPKLSRRSIYEALKRSCTDIPQCCKESYEHYEIGCGSLNSPQQLIIYLYLSTLT